MNREYIGDAKDFQFTLTHCLDMTFSVGCAESYESGNKLGGEWVASLKLLAFDLF